MREKRIKIKEREENVHVLAGVSVRMVVTAKRTDSEALRPGGKALIIFFIHQYDRIVGSVRHHPFCGTTEDIRMCNKTL